MFKSSETKRLSLSCVALIATTFLTTVAVAQSVSDFKDAAGRAGCGLIPYSSPRRSCESRGRDVDNYCKKQTWNCDDLNPDGLKKNIENVKRKLEELKKERSNLYSKKGSSTNASEKHDIEREISEIDKEIKKFEDMMNDWRRKLDDEKNEIDDRLSIGNQCRSHREAVAKVFREVKSLLQSEIDKEKKPYAQEIVKKIAAEESGHRKAIEKVSEGIEKCQRMR
jgi:hypothetical protein